MASGELNWANDDQSGRTVLEQRVLKLPNPRHQSEGTQHRCRHGRRRDVTASVRLMGHPEHIDLAHGLPDDPHSIDRGKIHPERFSDPVVVPRGLNYGTRVMPRNQEVRGRTVVLALIARVSFDRHSNHDAGRTKANRQRRPRPDQRKPAARHDRKRNQRSDHVFGRKEIMSRQDHASRDCDADDSYNPQALKDNQASVPAT
jgi:hypothetical protein